MVENFEFQAGTGSVMHIKTKFTITTKQSKARLVWLVRPGHGRRLGMNSSIQDVAVRDRLVHSELSGVVVCSALVAVYHCFITHQITTRSRARVNPRICAALMIFANKQRHTVLFININQTPQDRMLCNKCLSSASAIAAFD